MGMLICPLCCEDEFTDQLALRYHLLSIIDNVYCPQCSERFDTILQLAKHLDGMCGNVDDNGDEFKLESYSDKENKINMEHCTQESTTDMNDVEILQHESCEVEESPVSVMAPETQQTQMIGVTTLEMDTSTTGLSDFGNNCSQVIEQSIHSTSHNDLRDIEEQSQDEEVEPMTTCDTSNVNNSDVNEQQIYSCSVCDVTFTSISEHIRVFHKGQEVAIKGVMDKNKAVLERLVDVEDTDTYLLGRRYEKLVHVEKRIRDVSSAVHINMNDDKLAGSQSFPLCKGNTAIVYHEDKHEQESPNLKVHEKFIKNELKMELTNKGETSCMDVNLTSSDKMKKELKTPRLMKIEKKSIEKLFSGSSLVKKNKNILSELCETIVKSPAIEEEEVVECSKKALIKNTISIFTCTVCQMEFGNMSMFKKHSCPRSRTGSKSMKTVCLKPETVENTTDCSQDSDGRTKLQLVLQVVRCKFCSMTFNKMGAFRKHMRTHNTPQFKHLLCPVCRMLCSSNLELTKHVKNMHLMKNLDL